LSPRSPRHPPPVLWARNDAAEIVIVDADRLAAPCCAPAETPDTGSWPQSQCLRTEFVSPSCLPP
jgi:hypothetical protein